MKKTIVIDQALASQRGAFSSAYLGMSKLITSVAKSGAAVPDQLVDRYVAAYQAMVAVDDQIRAAYVAPLEEGGQSATWTINAAAGTITVTLAPAANAGGTEPPTLGAEYQARLACVKQSHERMMAHYRELYGMRMAGASLEEELDWQLRREDTYYKDAVEELEEWLAAMVCAGYGTEADYTALTGKPFPADTEAANGEV